MMFIQVLSEAGNVLSIEDQKIGLAFVQIFEQEHKNENI